LTEFLTYAVYRLLGGLVGSLPPGIGYRLAGWAGGLLYTFSPRLRRTLAENIRHVLGPDADPSRIDDLVRQACVHNVKGHYDLFRLERLRSDEIEDMLQVEGWELLESALAQGKGAIIFSAHLGNVDLVIQLAVIRGLLAIAPVQRIRPERLFQYTLRLRTSHGLKLIPSDQPMMGLLRALKRGGVVGLAADRDATNSGQVMDFFGSPARLPDGPVRLAMRTGSPLIGAFALRLADDSFLVRIEPPIELPRTGNQDADLEAGMELVVAAVERHVGQHPEQWLLAQPVWNAG
jgi:KDO2-lipid IV(A) lauroyltransferase